MKKISIIGLGLMGGSLGMALKKAGLVEKVCAYARREETRNKALEMGVADEVFDSVEAAVEGADIVIFCVPVLTIPDLASKSIEHLSDSCVVTDVGSTKAQIDEDMRAIFSGASASFVGSHPICGSEKAGISASRIDLYQGAVVVMTEDNPMLRAFWESVGSNVFVMDAESHDRVIARASHLPHVVAALLASHVLQDDDFDIVKLCGSGVRDATRIAGGSEEVWHDIVKSNRDMVLAEVEKFEEELKSVKRLISDEDYDGLRSFFHDAREKRARL